MGSYYILLIRLILSVIISLVVCRMFAQGTPVKIAVLAVLLCSLAYLFEYLRKVGKKDNTGS